MFTLVHRVGRTAVLGEEALRAVTEGSGIALRGREVVELTRRRAIFTPL